VKEEDRESNLESLEKSWKFTLDSIPLKSSAIEGENAMTRERIGFRIITLLFILPLLMSMLSGAVPESYAGTDPAPSPSTSPTSTAPSDSGNAPGPSPAVTPEVSPPLPPSQQASPVPSQAPDKDEAQSELEAILQKMKMVNNGLKDYSSDVKVTGMGRYSILDIPLYVEGVYYYKEPDKHRLKVNRGPHYLSQYPQAFGWSLPNPQDWTCKVKEASENGKTYLILKLVPVMGMGDLLKVEMWVDKSSYLFGKQVYFYRDGGKMSLDSSYRTVNGYSLFNKLVGHIEFPKKNIKADAEVEYGDYRINQGIDDSVFQDPKK